MPLENDDALDVDDIDDDDFNDDLDDAENTFGSEYWSGNQSADPAWLTDGAALLPALAVEAADTDLVSYLKVRSRYRADVALEKMMAVWAMPHGEPVVAAPRTAWNGCMLVQVGVSWFNQERLSVLTLATGADEYRAIVLPDSLGEQRSAVCGLRNGERVFILQPTTGPAKPQEATS